MFRLPFEEFEIHLVEVPPSESVSVPTNPGPLLALVQRGTGAAKASGGAADGAAGLAKQLELRRGSVVFIPAGAAVEYSAGGGEALQLWVAAVNAKVFAPAAVPAAEAVPEPALIAA